MTRCLPEHLLTSLLLIALPLHIVDPQSQVVDLTLSALQQTKVGVVSVGVLHKALKQKTCIFVVAFHKDFDKFETDGCVSIHKRAVDKCIKCIRNEIAGFTI